MQTRESAAVAIRRINRTYRGTPREAATFDPTSLVEVVNKAGKLPSALLDLYCAGPSDPGCTNREIVRD